MPLRILLLVYWKVPRNSRKKIRCVGFVNYMLQSYGTNTLPIETREVNSLNIFKRKKQNNTSTFFFLYYSLYFISTSTSSSPSSSLLFLILLYTSSTAAKFTRVQFIRVWVHDLPVCYIKVIKSVEAIRTEGIKTRYINFSWKVN